MAMFLMINPDEILGKWARALPETLSPSDIEKLKTFVQDESIGPSNDTIKSLISYYGKPLAQQLEIPQEILSEIPLFGDENIQYDKFCVDYWGEDNDYKVVRSQFVDLGLVASDTTVKFEAFGIQWSLNRFPISFPEEMLMCKRRL